MVGERRREEVNDAKRNTVSTRKDTVHDDRVGLAINCANGRKKYRISTVSCTKLESLFQTSVGDHNSQKPEACKI